jgi:hypothetical protein
MSEKNFKNRGMNRSEREKSVDRLSWNVQKSTFLKSDVSVINLQIQNNFKNKMHNALDKMSQKLARVGESKQKKERVLFNFSKILDLYEQYLRTLLKSGHDSQIIKSLIQNIVQIAGPIKKKLSKKKFKKDLQNLNTDSMYKIIAFLKNILMKNFLKQSHTFESNSQYTNNFGTLSSNRFSNTYNSQVEQNMSKKKFSEMSPLPIYSSEVYKRNIGNPQLQLNYKKTDLANFSQFKKRRSINNNELRNFCIILNYKLNFKIKKQAREMLKLLKNPRRKSKKNSWKTLPRIFVSLMNRKLQVSIKMLKINNLQLRIKLSKKSSKRRKNFK